MDLRYSAEEESFREEVRDWLARNLPEDWARVDIRRFSQDQDRDIQRQWQRRLYEGGWLTLGWSKEHGGRGASPVMLAIFQEELARAGAPEVLGRTGAVLHAPTLMAYGSEWQKETYVRRLLSGDIIFCQAWSEPNAGSDMAGLRTRAVQQNEKWVINGQKIWSGGAHYADKALLLARTDPDLPPHKGLGMFIVDMHQPGIEARPIRQMMGRAISRVTGSGEFCEIFFNDAVVEPQDVLGGPTDGWKMAMAVSGFERNGLTNPFKFEKLVASLVELARVQGRSADPLFRQRIAQAKIEAHIFRLTSLRNLTRAEKGLAPGPEASLTKLYWSEMDQRLEETAIALQGMYGALDPDGTDAIDDGIWQYRWMFSQAETIYGGTSDIQRNQIAERVLGLPRSR